MRRSKRASFLMGIASIPFIFLSGMAIALAIKMGGIGRYHIRVAVIAAAIAIICLLISYLTDPRRKENE